jgi:hypothetical protein
MNVERKTRSKTAIVDEMMTVTYHAKLVIFLGVCSTAGG